MSGFDANWDATLRYRCFVDRDAGTATIVGSRIVDDVGGRRVGRVVFALDAAYTVCDVEMTMSAECHEARHDLTPDASESIRRVDTTLATLVTIDSDPIIAVEGDWLVASFKVAEAAG
jgi:hypothetical protein